MLLANIFPLIELVWFGSLVFWILFAVASLCIIDGARRLSYRKAEGGSLVGWTITIFILLNVCFVDWKSFEYDSHTLLKYALLYSGIGITWGLMRWYLYVRSVVKDYLALKNKWLKDKSLDTETDKTDFKNWVKNQDSRFSDIRCNFRLEQYATDYKSWCMFNTFFWPWSIIAWIAGSFIVDFWDWVYDRIGFIYNKISSAVFHGVGDDVK